MEYRLIKVFENDYDYNYEQLFLVKCDKKQKEELLKLANELSELDWEERIKKYGDNAESKIDFIESYIMNNFEVIKADMIDIDCY